MLKMSHEQNYKRDISVLRYMCQMIDIYATLLSSHKIRGIKITLWLVAFYDDE